LPVREVADRRTPDPRSPLVLLHPFSLCAEVWRPVLPLLDRTHDVHPLTIPGHLGGEPLPRSFRHSVEAAVDLLETKLDALGLRKAHLVGNSLGGWFALELARRNRALSVVALAPGGGWELGSPELRRLVRRFRLTWALLRLGGPAAGVLSRYAILRRATLGQAVARPERLAPEVARMFIESAWRCSSFSAVLKCMAKQALPEPFERMSCPVRLVWGSHDRLLPLEGYSQRWRRVLPQADWVVLQGVGHVQMHDDPEAVARSILEVTSPVRLRRSVLL
jgi:pimeloyl-ACP methyl ester carboxylesterase